MPNSCLGLVGTVETNSFHKPTVKEIKLCQIKQINVMLELLFMA